MVRAWVAFAVLVRCAIGVDVVDDAAALTFEAFFESYALPALPVVLRRAESLGEDVSKCLDKAVCTTLVVPKFVANDYVVRAATIEVRRLGSAAAQQQIERTVAPDVLSTFVACAAPAHSYFSVLRGTATLTLGGASTIMAVGQALFLPLGAAVDVGSVSADAKVARFCFIDASNFVNATRALAAWPAAQMWQGRGIDGQAIGRALGGADFETTMERVAAPLAWSLFVDWPRAARPAVDAAAAPADGAAAADGAVDGAADGAADVVQLKRARGSRGSRAGAFRGWQSEQRWKWLVTAATIPQLGAPTISELKRNSAAVAFTSAYSPKTGDDSQFGFVVRFEAVEDAGDAGETAFDAVDVYSGKNFTFADDTVARAARPTVAGLGAGTAYRFKVRVFYGDAFGSWSAYSEIATTPTRGAPAQPPPPVVRRDPTQLAISHAFDD
ncbi:hypothetical protein M885DRAFT_585886, partial [Pelagophyceae sp. CCMP2097]